MLYFIYAIFIFRILFCMLLSVCVCVAYSIITSALCFMFDDKREDKTVQYTHKKNI